MIDPEGVSADSVVGTLTTTPSDGTYRIEVFASPTCDSIGGNGEGETLLGSTSVLVDGTGSAAWRVDVSGALNDGDAVTATATAPDGSTSEFSPCVTAGLGGSTTSDTTTTTAPPLAPDGSGTLTTPLTTFVAGSTGNTITFTYTAAEGGMSDGALVLGVPSGWSEASTTSGADGYTTASTGNVHTDPSGIFISGISLAGGDSLTITYGDKAGDGHGATAPSAPGTQVWPAQQRSSGATGTLTPIPSPSIVVGPAASGGDSLTFPTPSTDVAAAGTSPIAGNSLHLNALPGKADIEIAIDTTASMDTSINQAKADATNLVNSVKAGIPDAQFTVVQFRDSGDAPEYQVVQAPTRTRPQCSRRSTA